MKTARSQAVALLLAGASWMHSSTAWADPREAPPSAGKGLDTAYPAEPPPSDFLQRTSWLWEFDDAASPGQAKVFFTITRGHLSDPYDSWPTILVKHSEGWRVVNLQERFSRYIWRHAASAPRKGYFWGFLEYAVEDAGSEWPLIMSRDGGRTWTHVTTIQKPDREATFVSFEMTATGRGRIQWLSRKGAPPGMRKRFTSVTTDWGRNWRKGPTVELSVVEEGREPANDTPCWVAVTNLPEPLPEACRFPTSISSQLGGTPGSSPTDNETP